MSRPDVRHLAEADLPVCACDNLVGLDFARLFDFYAQTRDPVVAVHPEANRERLHLSGVVEREEDMSVKVMDEKPWVPRTDLACCPIYVFPPSVLKLVSVYLDQGGNPDAPRYLVSWLVKRMPVKAFLFHEPVYALDSIATYEWLNRHAEQVDKELG